jgi:protein-arginine kinase activator protein McsA
LKEEYDHLVAYAENHHIHMPPSVTRKNMAQDDAGKGKVSVQSITYEEKFEMVREYLLEMIKIEDYDNSGVLDDNDLWLILNDMELGYTEEEMAAFSAW